MSLKASFKKLIRISQNTYAMLPVAGIRRPIFITGCGRSGTTILGRALSKHRDVTYLNEPRHLWASAYPETDIWSPEASARNAKLSLMETDTEARKTNKLSRLFRFEIVKSGKSALVEKLPINCFRLNFIHHMFPDARFIHIYRNGLEVARSIEALSRRGHWFSENPYKWEKLVEYTKDKDGTNKLPTLCSNYYDKGLLEWRLSTEAVVEFLSDLRNDTFLELSYDEFTRAPVRVISRVLNFTGIDDDRRVREYVSDNVARRTNKLNASELEEKEKILGGKLLPLSMETKGLTGRFQ